MKYQSLSIGNFKAFGPVPQRIPLKAITLVFGPSSAGKSSILHALLYLQHALEAKSLDPRHTRTGGAAVDLGGISQCIHRHLPGSRISFTVEFVLLDKEDVPYSELKRPAVIAIALMIECLAAGQPVVSGWALGIDGEDLLSISADPSGRLRITRFNTMHPVVLRILMSVLGSEHFATADSDTFDPIDSDLLPWFQSLLEVIPADYGSVYESSDSFEDWAEDHPFLEVCSDSILPGERHRCRSGSRRTRMGPRSHGWRGRLSSAAGGGCEAEMANHGEARCPALASRYVRPCKPNGLASQNPGQRPGETARKQDRRARGALRMALTCAREIRAGCPRSLGSANPVHAVGNPRLPQTPLAFMYIGERPLVAQRTAGSSGTCMQQFIAGTTARKAARMAWTSSWPAVLSISDSGIG